MAKTLETEHVNEIVEQDLIFKRNVVIRCVGLDIEGDVAEEGVCSSLQNWSCHPTL